MTINVYRPEGLSLEDALAWEKRGLLEKRMYRDDMLRLLGEQSAVIIHELRSPLQAISAQLQVARKLIRRDVGQRHDPRFQMIFDELHRMEEMMDQFLQLSSLRQPQWGPVSLVDLCIQTGQLLRSLCLYQKVELLVEDDLELPPIRGDQQKLRQVLTNLIVNAVQACTNTGRGTGQIRITILDQPEGYQTVTVRDTGCGLDPEAMDRLFEPFYTTKERGTGLGLALSRQIALDHGGDLLAANNPDGPGACFTLRLPVDGPQPQSETEPA